MNDLAKALAGLEGLSTPAPRPSLPASLPPSVRPAARLWTPEQEAVLVAREDRIDAVALAGTGKTAVLGEFARRRARAKWRYLTFNRALADAAVATMPSNVRAGTFHALAFPRYGAPLGAKLGKRFNPEEVRRAVGWDCFDGWETAVAALRQWRDGFLASTASVPALSQLPPAAWAWLVARPGVLDAIGGSEGFLRSAERLWDVTLDGRWTEIDAPSETPLKLMALAGVSWGADGILVDEAQDLTPAMMHGLSRQGAQIITAGDPSQNLYAWRRAGNAWPTQEARRFALTGSFRFGEPVATMANRCLERLGQQERLVGLRSDSSVTPVDGPLASGTTWLARTQAGAIVGALAALEQGLRPAWVGKGSLARLQAVMDVAEGRPSSDPWLAGLTTLDAVASTASEAGALEWRSAVRLIQRQGPAQVKKALQEMVTHQGRAEVSIATVHQAKGQTFDRVRLADDLRWESGDAEEQRVLYVAVTRSAHLECSPIAYAHMGKSHPATGGGLDEESLSDSGF